MARDSRLSFMGAAIFMANRRMFSKAITESDAFLSMAQEVQNLYFHLGMQADDDGFVSPRRVMRMVGAAEDSLVHLVSRGFLIPFDSGVVVVTDWKENNYLRPDRYKQTQYKKEMALLSQESGRYTIGIPNVIPLVGVGKDRIGKDRKEEIVKTISSSPLEIREVRIDNEGQERPQKQSVKKSPAVLSLLEKLYDLLERENGVRPTYHAGDYMRLLKALQILPESQIIEMLEDAVAVREVVTVREVLTIRQIDKKRIESV